MTGSYHAMPTLPNALSWADRAACRGYDLGVFFSEADQKVHEAKAICRRCPVVAECLAETLRAEVTPRYGICGGLTPDERDALVGQDDGQEARQSRRGLAPCGTLGAYRRHFRRGEPACRECSKANAERQARRKAAECGTRAGYGKHLREKTEICAPCRQANTDADNRLRRTGSSKAPT